MHLTIALNLKELHLKFLSEGAVLHLRKKLKIPGLDIEQFFRQNWIPIYNVEIMGKYVRTPTLQTKVRKDVKREWLDLLQILEYKCIVKGIPL